MRRDVGQALLVSDAEEHAWRRAAMQPLFTKPSVAAYEGVISRSIAETVRRWSAVDSDTRTLRLMPPSFAILRETTKPVVIGGVQIPARAFVVCCPYVTQRDPRWYPEPLRFLPERATLYPAAPHFSFFPFGHGPKFCLGKTLAETETQLVIAELVRNFRFRRDAGWFIQPITRVAVKPIGGLRLSVEPRRTAPHHELGQESIVEPTR